LLSHPTRVRGLKYARKPRPIADFFHRLLVCIRRLHPSAFSLKNATPRYCGGHFASASGRFRAGFLCFLRFLPLRFIRRFRRFLFLLSAIEISCRLSLVACYGVWILIKPRRLF
jgi:hypothetical protein